MKSMLLKNGLLQKAKLYLILDAEVCSAESLIQITHEGLKAGIEIFQLRAKKLPDEETLRIAFHLRAIIDERALFIMNDSVELALQTNADGVHLGQEDGSLLEARTQMEERIIGISCQTFTQAKQAEANAADYIGFGSVFKTQTKPEREVMDLNLLKDVVESIEIPVFPIGGIDLSNIQQVYDIGARRFAVCRAVCESKDINLAVNQFFNFCH